MDSQQTAAKASAPGQYLGYSLQTVRLCYHLLESDEQSIASIEHFDDIAVTNCDNSALLEQTKSALTQNPVADWSEDLWKTFTNWLHTIKSGTVNPSKTRFQLYVTPLKTGYWVNRLSNTNTPDDVSNLVDNLADAISMHSRPPRCADYISQLLEEDRELVTTLISNFRYISDSDPINPLRKILKLAVQDELLDWSCGFAVGLAHQKADSLIRSGKPALIHAGSFQREIRAFFSKHNLSKMLPSFSDSPEDEIIERTFNEQPMFVQQLGIIDVSRREILRAISDFMQSASDKTNWAEKGLVFKNSLEEFDQKLVRRYSTTRMQTDAQSRELDPSDRGQILYSKCISTDEKMEGREIPDHFVPGCYNNLADSLKVGWHPNFETLLGNGH